MIEIVQFNNGKCAVRRNDVLGFQYKSIIGNYWWGVKENVQRYCATKSISRIKKVYAKAIKHQNDSTVNVIDIKDLPPTFGEKLYEQISNLKKKYFW